MQKHCKEGTEVKQIATIAQWEACFYSLMSVLAVRQPHRFRDLLAYSSMITKAANNCEGNPRLTYDIHFRTLAASMNLQIWARVDQALWSQHFNWAAARRESSDCLSIDPYHQQARLVSVEPRSASKGASPTGKERLSMYPKAPPICIKWNRDDCRSTLCTY